MTLSDKEHEMAKKIVMWAVVTLLLAIPISSFSETETRDYIVKKGDTLWGISGKELSDTFLWPKVWKENPTISNPDRLYPGQKITMPLYLMQKEAKEREETPPQPVVIIRPVQEPAKQEEKKAELFQVAESSVLLASGYISPILPNVGMIQDSPSGRSLYGKNDAVYIKTREAVNPRDKFYIVRAGQEVYHPVSHKKTGYVIEILGIAEVSQIEYGDVQAVITEAFDEINAGDLLDNYYEKKPQMLEKPFRTPDLEGLILATEQLRILSGNMDIVFLDKGRKDGILTGDMFKILETSKGHYIPVGTLQVIDEKETTSTAIVRTAKEPIEVGSLFSPLQ